MLRNNLPVFVALIAASVSLQAFSQVEERFSVVGLPGKYSTLSQAEAALRAIGASHATLKKENIEVVSKDVIHHHYEAEDVEPQVSDLVYRARRLRDSPNFYTDPQVALETEGAAIYDSGGCQLSFSAIDTEWPVCNGNWLKNYPRRNIKEITSSGVLRSITEINRRYYRVNVSCASLEYQDGLTLVRENIKTCPSPYQGKRTSCAFECVNPTTGKIIEQVDGKEDGCSKNNEANPCNVSTGNKYQPETDFSTGGFTFTRTYNSNNLVDLGLGKGWRSQFHKRLLVGDTAILQVSASGRVEPWARSGNALQGDADSKILLSVESDGFLLTQPSGASEKYDSEGRFVRHTTSNGYGTTLSYNDQGLLESVINGYGSQISFTYQAGLLKTVTDALGAVYEYRYTNENLSLVIYPDLTPLDNSDNPQRIYHYEDQAHPNHLTGITDENGVRFSTYEYDAQGRAVVSKHAETSTPNTGQETFTFEHDYQLEAQQ